MVLLNINKGEKSKREKKMKEMGQGGVNHCNKNCENK